MITCNSDDMVLSLQHAPVDKRTGNKVVLNASWTATNDSMIGKRNEDWVMREISWFARGSNDLADMDIPVPKAFRACAGKHGTTVNSAYGHILFSHKGEDLPDSVHLLSLAERMVQAFEAEGKGTRHAVAIISDRDIHMLRNKDGREDFICTNAINCMIDADDKLHITAQMRSMDAVWGYRADYSMWDYLMGWMLDKLCVKFPNLKRGDITFQVANLHVYPRHFEMLAKEADIVQDRMDAKARRIWLDRDKKKASA